MCIVTDIHDYREQQYAQFQESISAPVVETELVKCSGCYDEVEPSEIKVIKMHDVNDGKELPYCLTCIEIYKNENL